MNFFRPRSAFLFLFSVLAPLSACTSLPVAPKVAPEIALTPPVAEEISFEQLKRFLPHHPIVVGFDVDDTLVFSAPAFNALQPHYDAAVIRPKIYASLSPEQKKQYHEFWNLLNEQYDDRSIPKKSGNNCSICIWPGVTKFGSFHDAKPRSQRRPPRRSALSVCLESALSTR